MLTYADMTAWVEIQDGLDRAAVAQEPGPERLPRAARQRIALEEQVTRLQRLIHSQPLPDQAHPSCATLSLQPAPGPFAQIFAWHSSPAWEPDSDC